MKGRLDGIGHRLQGFVAGELRSALGKGHDALRLQVVAPVATMTAGELNDQEGHHG